MCIPGNTWQVSFSVWFPFFALVSLGFLLSGNVNVYQ